MGCVRLTWHSSRAATTSAQSRAGQWSVGGFGSGGWVMKAGALETGVLF
jgi:hypothetical protein